MAIRFIKSKLLVILGSTSTGKTDLALSLAKKFNGELISCDSRQVYVGLDIGTGKAPSGECKVQSEKCKVKKGKGFWEINGIRIWMYDVVDPKKQYTVYDFVKDAERVVDEIFKRGKLPIIVGGTGLYLKALLEGLPNLAIPIDSKLREELGKLSLQQLQAKLQKLFPHRWEKMNNSDRQNPRRLIRAIEISSIMTPPRSNFVTPRRWSASEESLRATIRGDFSKNDILKIGLTAPREILYNRIDERVISRINQGMIDEAKKLHKAGLTLKRMRQLGLEYGVLADFLAGRIVSKEDLIKVMQGKIHGYARRQITWFKKEKEVFWFDVANKEFGAQVEKEVAKWYHHPDDTKN